MYEQDDTIRHVMDEYASAFGADDMEHDDDLHRMIARMAADM